MSIEADDGPQSRRTWRERVRLHLEVIEASTGDSHPTAAERHAEQRAAKAEASLASMKKRRQKELLDLEKFRAECVKEATRGNFALTNNQILESRMQQLQLLHEALIATVLPRESIATAFGEAFVRAWRLEHLQGHRPRWHRAWLGLVDSRPAIHVPCENGTVQVVALGERAS